MEKSKIQNCDCYVAPDFGITEIMTETGFATSPARELSIDAPDYFEGESIY